jgi:hypothetical protein
MSAVRVGEVSVDLSLDASTSSRVVRVQLPTGSDDFVFDESSSAKLIRAVSADITPSVSIAASAQVVKLAASDMQLDSTLSALIYITAAVEAQIEGLSATTSGGVRVREVSSQIDSDLTTSVDVKRVQYGTAEDQLEFEYAAGSKVIRFAEASISSVCTLEAGELLVRWTKRYNDANSWTEQVSDEPEWSAISADEADWTNLTNDPSAWVKQVNETNSWNKVA